MPVGEEQALTQYKKQAPWHLSFHLLLLCGMADVAMGQSCSSSSTCPEHANDKELSCFLKAVNNMWGFSQVKNMNFPGIGLYTLAKVSKDSSNCCYDLEVQAFLCNAERSGTRVNSLQDCLP